MNNGQTEVVNVRVHAFDVYVGHSGFGYITDGLLGNPYKVKPPGDQLARIVCIRKFLRYFKHRMGIELAEEMRVRLGFDDFSFKYRVKELKGKRLGCFCAPALCHATVYAAWLNDGLEGLRRFEQQINELERKCT